jgi:hypothetical protein
MNLIYLFYYLCYRGIEAYVGIGKIDFKCFANCNEDLNLTMIKVNTLTHF